MLILLRLQFLRRLERTIHDEPLRIGDGPMRIGRTQAGHVQFFLIDLSMKWKDLHIFRIPAQHIYSGRLLSIVLRHA